MSQMVFIPVFASRTVLRSCPVFSKEMSILKVWLSREAGGDATEKVMESMASHPTDSMGD